MTKKMLISWLHAKKAEALNTVELQRAKAFQDFSERLYAHVGLREVADKVQSLFNEVDNLVAAWHETYSEYLGDGGQYYGSIHNAVYDFISSPNATYDRMKHREVDDNSPRRKEIRSAFDTLRADVSKNYDSVILNVQRLKDAKLGLEYLKELGFDLADLLAQDTAPVETALAVPIDTRFLILTKEETQNEN